MERISVIIPVYNRCDVLRQCVQSVQSQTYPELEIILVDDGSEDGSPELCFQLAEEDSRIRVCRLRHRGVSSARNAGLLRAEGEYLYFLDSDDVIAPDMLQTMADHIKQTGADMACCRFRMKMREGEFIPTPGESVVLPPREAFEKMLLNEGLLGYGVSTGTKLVKRELIFQPYPLLFDKKTFFGEDTMWVAGLLERAERVCMDSSIFMQYTADSENSICHVIPAQEKIRHTRWKLQYLQEHGYSGEVIARMRREESRFLTFILLGM